MKKPKTIGIFAFPTFIGPWDPDSIKTGLLGSEEALHYMSQALADLGYKVTVFANPPVNSRHSAAEANPRFIDSNAKIEGRFDIAISWRMPTIAKNLKKYADKVYFWPHDATPYLHIIDDEIQAFDGIFWVSEFHRKQFINVHPSFSKFTQIFGNGIDPKQFNSIEDRTNPYSCIYASCWSRGLETLLNIWPEVKQKHPKATLDIYYGTKDLPVDLQKKLRTKIAELIDVYDRGMVGHEELAKAYEKSSLWTYPCQGVETFCISALKAQLAGAIPVIIEGSALSETVHHGYKCHRKEEYLSTLLNAMGEAEKIAVDDRKKMGEFVLKEFTWKKIALKWQKAFELEDQTNCIISDEKQSNERYVNDAKILERAISKNPNNSAFVFHLAINYLLAGQDALALEYFIRRAQMGGFWVEVYISLYQVTILQKRLGVEELSERQYLQFLKEIPWKTDSIFDQLYGQIEYFSKIKEFILGYLESQFLVSLIKSVSFDNENKIIMSLVQHIKCAKEVGKYKESKEIANEILSLKNISENDRLQFANNYL